MATTFELIKGETLSGTAVSYTFSAIPSTFTDLCLKFSGRSNHADYNENVRMTFNGATTNFSVTYIRGVNTTASSSRSSNANALFPIDADANTATTNTFGSAEIYIPSYTASQNKPLSNFSVTENNSSTAWVVNSFAGLWSNTSAISSLTLSLSYGDYFLANSSFYLYGIKNS